MEKPRHEELITATPHKIFVFFFFFFFSFYRLAVVACSRSKFSSEVLNPFVIW
jgi:hypothetical protein